MPGASPPPASPPGRHVSFLISYLSNVCSALCFPVRCSRVCLALHFVKLVVGARSGMPTVRPRISKGSRFRLDLIFHVPSGNGQGLEQRRCSAEHHSASACDYVIVLDACDPLVGSLGIS